MSMRTPSNGFTGLSGSPPVVESQSVQTIQHSAEKIGVLFKVFGRWLWASACLTALRQYG